ncbi:phosphodiester glycosidase family protein [Salinimicrobium terrae]|uniref:phosphodiester glycosidase family protein n=1 Tax=Salinimicrobium terrae TaxID=470866 RepID=UPI00040E338A|nr:phosphodiester glycosidase family protein [Salinimicrobium terrae]
MYKRVFHLLLFFSLGINWSFAQEINIQWQPREDLNILLPASVQVYDGFGSLVDGEPVRGVYAKIDLADKNLKLRAIGSNTHRETTEETHLRNNGILSINGGYFAATSSVSLLISDGELVASGNAVDVPRGAFGMINGNPEITWTGTSEDNNVLINYETPGAKNGQSYSAAQAVGGGPVLLTNGEINVTAKEEGFGGSHVMRHPRTAIGYDANGNLIMMVIDGRQKASAGVTLPELAFLMQTAGAKEALNLDGGGSSAMIAASEVVNIPTDIPGGNRNSLRNNASALVLSEYIPSEGKEVVYYDTSDDNYKEYGLWKNSNSVNYYGDTPSRSTSAGQFYNRAIYKFKDLPQKNYQVAAWWAVNDDQNTSKAAYVVHRYKSSDTIYVDQSNLHTDGKWNILGNFNVGPRDSLEILGGGQDGNLVTDAIRLVPTQNSPQLPVRGDVRIAVISDLNSGLGAAKYEWQVDSIIKRIPRLWKPDLVVSGGDMVAGMGIDDTLTLQKMWAGFDEHIATPLKNANIPFAFTLGNHDGPRSYELERKMTAQYWNENLPDLNFVDSTHFPHYYSFVQDGIFFVSWDASSSEITSENLKWMEEQFRTPEAKNADYRFVLGHMPLYSVAQERDSRGNVLQEPEKLRKLLEQNNVHTYISGHQHAFYPGKRGYLKLLNTGAAGSGPRGWLTLEDPPVNTVTIMDIFKDKDSIAYTTYEIKTKDAGDMKLFDESRLPSSVFGVNGHILRQDIPVITEASGTFNPVNDKEKGSGTLKAEIKDGKLIFKGKLGELSGKPLDAGLYKGRNTESGEFLTSLNLKSRRRTGTLTGSFTSNRDLKEFLSAGALHVIVRTKAGELRAQLYPKNNRFPPAPNIISHEEKNIYGVRDLQALYELEWEKVNDPDGDFVSYQYELATDRDFKNVIFKELSGRSNSIKLTEEDWFSFLGNASEGQPVTFYHRVTATDGENTTQGPVTALRLIKSTQPLDDFIEVPAPEIKFTGKIHASGAGYGAEWDNEGKIWLADYNNGLIVKNKDGKEVSFSPLTHVSIKGQEFSLRPVNGIGVDLDGNILVGRNRHLLKIDAKTGKGIAAWEVPEGERAITAPRASASGEIYAMSLFGDDPNYVLKQSTEDPSSFELVRTLDLNDRILSRTFDMTRDGKILYFPDPGSPVIQKYTSDDGIRYQREKDISSTASGSSAIQVMEDGRLFAAVRASGISPSTFHFRDENEQRMWTVELPEVNGAEPRGIGVSPDGKTLIFGSWDKGGGFYIYKME